MPNAKDACLGCGGEFAAEDGPTHAYMLSSPACWRNYGELLAAEYSSEELMVSHRLSVDAYAIQHPGDGSRRAIQSVGLHLARLKVQLDKPQPPMEVNQIMKDFSRRKSSLQLLEPPRSFAMTIADVTPHIGTENHATLVTAWAKSAWNDWREHHDYIEVWINSCYA